jgi:hypothetical protein
MRLIKQTRSKVLLLAGLMVFLPAVAYAQSSNSTNYRVDQTFFGSGGELNACSAAYCSKQTAGELGVGNTASTSYQAYAGFNTTDDPFLEFVVTGDNIDLNYLDTGSAKTANGTFAVRAWQAGGYVVRTHSPPPTNPQGGHQLAPLATPTASSPGTEQFGINLIKNTDFCGTGCHLGDDPQQMPDGTFSFGQAASGYNTPSLFKYVQGDTVASSNQSTSITVFTISYIFNINNFTSSGQYKFVHNLVATATY